MRYAIVSDIHANLQAWQATLADIQQAGVHQIVCLGDVVGYGPNPQEVYESVREVADGCILGNHDAVVCNRLDPIAFNPNARRIIEWTEKQLDDEAKKWFGGLPMIIESNSFDCSHAEFEVPGRFRYIFSAQDALPSFRCSEKPALFVGHTHRPGAVVLDSSNVPRSLPANRFDFLDGCRYLINVGSVGDPRNGETTGSYAILDVEDGSLDFRKVPFDVEAYRKAIVNSGLQTKPMLFNFVGSTPKTDSKSDDQPEDEFKPSDTNLAKAPEGGAATATIETSGAATGSDKGTTGGADAETIGRGAALLLIPLVVVGAILLMTRPNQPQPKEPTITQPETSPEQPPSTSVETQQDPPTEPKNASDDTNSGKTTDVTEQVNHTQQPPPDDAAKEAIAAIQWPDPNDLFPGREFRLKGVTDLESISAVAEAVIAGAPKLAVSRATAYERNNAELAAAAPATYATFAKEVAATARWQQILAASFERGIGQSGMLKTMYGEQHVRIQSVAENGLNVLVAQTNAPAIDAFIPFDDLPYDERNKRLTGPTPETTAIMRGLSSLRAGLADDAKRAFAGVGSILAQGLLTLTIENEAELKNREGHRATAILYRLLGASSEQSPADLAAALSDQRIPMARLAQLRRASSIFQNRFSGTEAGTACAPLLQAIEKLTPDFVMPTAPNIAHALPMNAASTSQSVDKWTTTVDDTAHPDSFAKVSGETTTESTAAGELLSLLRQSDCPTIPLNKSLHGNPAMTIAFWAYPPDSSAKRTALSIGSESPQGRFSINFEDTLGVSIGDQHWDTGIPSRNELWQYHVVTRGEGGSLNWWIYDQKVANGRIKQALNLKKDLLLGANLGGLKGDRRVDVFRGLLKDVHVYPRILLDDEIRKLARQARTFTIAAGLNSRITPQLSTGAPPFPSSAFSPKSPSKETVELKDKVTWGETINLKAIEITGTANVTAAIPADVDLFSALAVSPTGDGIRGAVFRVRAVPGSVLAESLLVPPGKSVLFSVPFTMQTGRIQLETVIHGEQSGKSTWISPGFSKAEPQ